MSTSFSHIYRQLKLRITRGKSGSSTLPKKHGNSPKEEELALLNDDASSHALSQKNKTEQAQKNALVAKYQFLQASVEILSKQLHINRKKLAKAQELNDGISKDEKINYQLQNQAIQKILIDIEMFCNKNKKDGKANKDLRNFLNAHESANESTCSGLQWIELHDVLHTINLTLQGSILFLQKNTFNYQSHSVFKAALDKYVVYEKQLINEQQKLKQQEHTNTNLTISSTTTIADSRTADENNELLTLYEAMQNALYKDDIDSCITSQNELAQKLAIGTWRHNFISRWYEYLPHALQRDWWLFSNNLATKIFPEKFRIIKRASILEKILEYQGILAPNHGRYISTIINQVINPARIKYHQLFNNNNDSFKTAALFIKKHCYENICEGLSINPESLNVQPDYIALNKSAADIINEYVEEYNKQHNAYHEQQLAYVKQTFSEFIDDTPDQTSNYLSNNTKQRLRYAADSLISKFYKVLMLPAKLAITVLDILTLPRYLLAKPFSYLARVPGASTLFYTLPKVLHTIIYYEPKPFTQHYQQETYALLRFIERRFTPLEISNFYLVLQQINDNLGKKSTPEETLNSLYMHLVYKLDEQQHKLKFLIAKNDSTVQIEQQKDFIHQFKKHIQHFSKAHNLQYQLYKIIDEESGSTKYVSADRQYISKIKLELGKDKKNLESLAGGGSTIAAFGQIMTVVGFMITTLIALLGIALGPSFAIAGIIGALIFIGISNRVLFRNSLINVGKENALPRLNKNKKFRSDSLSRLEYIIFNICRVIAFGGALGISALLWNKMFLAFGSFLLLLFSISGPAVPIVTFFLGVALFIFTLFAFYQLFEIAFLNKITQFYFIRPALFFKALWLSLKFWDHPHWKYFTWERKVQYATNFIFRKIVAVLVTLTMVAASIIYAILTVGPFAKLFGPSTVHLKSFFSDLPQAPSTKEELFSGNHTSTANIGFQIPEKIADILAKIFASTFILITRLVFNVSNGFNIMDIAESLIKAPFKLLYYSAQGLWHYGVIPMRHPIKTYHTIAAWNPINSFKKLTKRILDGYQFLVTRPIPTEFEPAVLRQFTIENHKDIFELKRKIVDIFYNGHRQLILTNLPIYDYSNAGLAALEILTTLDFNTLTLRSANIHSRSLISLLTNIHCIKSLESLTLDDVNLPENITIHWQQSYISQLNLLNLSAKSLENLLKTYIKQTSNNRLQSLILDQTTFKNFQTIDSTLKAKLQMHHLELRNVTMHHDDTYDIPPYTDIITLDNCMLNAKFNETLKQCKVIHFKKPSAEINADSWKTILNYHNDPKNSSNVEQLFFEFLDDEQANYIAATLKTFSACRFSRIVVVNSTKHANKTLKKAVTDLNADSNNNVSFFNNNALPNNLTRFLVTGYRWLLNTCLYVNGFFNGITAVNLHASPSDISAPNVIGNIEGTHSNWIIQPEALSIVSGASIASNYNAIKAQTTEKAIMRSKANNSDNDSANSESTKISLRNNLIQRTTLPIDIYRSGFFGRSLCNATADLGHNQQNDLSVNKITFVI
ncbi:MAG: hypothetical protein Tsb005_09040 [Gammaproteobacteria bacterium]